MVLVKKKIIVGEVNILIYVLQVASICFVVKVLSGHNQIVVFRLLRF